MSGYEYHTRKSRRVSKTETRYLFLEENLQPEFNKAVSAAVKRRSGKSYAL